MEKILFISFFIFVIGLALSTDSSIRDFENYDHIEEISHDDQSPLITTEDFKNTDAVEINEKDAADVTKTEKEEAAKSNGIVAKISPGLKASLIITNDMDTSPNSASGVIYTRWGKLHCRTGAQMIYSGLVGGGHYNQKGNIARYLCLPRNPQYLSTDAPFAASYIHGAEYETGNKVFGKTTQDYNVPCAVCLSPKKGTKLVIPARVSCPSGWTEEYYGYYMSSYHGHNLNVNPECVDHVPDVINGSEANTNGVLFYFMQVTCGSGLPCGPYITDRAITCVVCTK
ncbi:PREDICTED: short-chain collagen C4-like isoform X1 [Amphimedon queenslandica]|uniref:Short-chain collagen C4-like n=2 Tax=Amphimedon queenslandica TaxID=400682 RepID=A0AAN0JA21_AMPQE|nr:PREDICTED: short-chain collagen C4-like isoform X1 [Amphimedon queenslandica]|eukprot:XP_019853558.1 PREDICTED: short-chain collagen C4-like isoform X1 [Amphimedon queenslandica]